jgi:hypothetical protein
MNFHFLPDMGRMNGRLRSEEETELSPVQTLAVIVPPPSIP